MFTLKWLSSYPWRSQRDALSSLRSILAAVNFITLE